jgi:hypothetical protein
MPPDLRDSLTLGADRSRPQPAVGKPATAARVKFSRASPLRDEDNWPIGWTGYECDLRGALCSRPSGASFQ